VTLSKLAEAIAESATLAIDTKAKALQAAGKSVVSFGIGQPDFPTPRPICDAATLAMGDGRTGYTPTLGEAALREAVVQKFLRENDLRYDASQIAVSSGGKTMLYEIFLALLDPGDEVIIPKPYWVSYPDQLKMVGAEAVLVDSDPVTFLPDSAEIAARITDKTKIIVLNAPNNPSGAVYPESFLQKIADLAIEHDLWVISDEVYEHFFYGTKAPSIANLGPEIFRRTIIVNAVSKTYSMTGWRIGYCAIPDSAVVAAIGRLQSHNLGNPASISQAAALAALSGNQESVALMRAAYVRRREKMLSWIERIPFLSCAPPGGAFYCFPRVALEGFDGFSLAEALLEEALVAVIPGVAFGMSEHIRLSYALADDKLDEGMARIEQWGKKR